MVISYNALFEVEAFHLFILLFPNANNLMFFYLYFIRFTTFFYKFDSVVDLVNYNHIVQLMHNADM